MDLIRIDVILICLQCFKQSKPKVGEYIIPWTVNLDKLLIRKKKFAKDGLGITCLQCSDPKVDDH